MKPKRRLITTDKDLEDLSPEELTALIVEKARTNPDGWTAAATRFKNVQLLRERETLQKVHRSGRKIGAIGLPRTVVRRLAPKCKSFKDLMGLLRREQNPDGPVIDVPPDETNVYFLDRSKRQHVVTHDTLKDYLREEIKALNGGK